MTQFCPHPGSSAFSSLAVSPVVPKISPPPVPSSAPSFGGPVTLNVGGTLYSTTLETLTRFPDSMLGAMFRAGTPIPPNLSPQGGGHYFIDRDGKAFRHILNFLRLGRLDLPRGYGETPGFLEEVLRVALEHSFRLDSVFPDPEDLLNSRSLRFVRH